MSSGPSIMACQVLGGFTAQHIRYRVSTVSSGLSILACQVLGGFATSHIKYMVSTVSSGPSILACQACQVSGPRNPLETVRF